MSSRPASSRLVVAAVTTSAMTIGTVAPYTLAALAPFVVPELGFTRAQFGSLVTVYFLVGAVVSPSLGSLVDSIGGWRMMLALFGVGAVSFLGMGRAPGYAWMAAAVGFSGIANALSNPATNQIISAHVAPGVRGTIVGVKQSGVQIGATASGLLLPPLALVVGWRASLVWCALVAVACTAGAWVARPERTPQQPRRLGADRTSGASVWWLVGYAFLMGSGVSVANTYIVLFSHEQLGLSAGSAGWPLGLLGASAAVARIAWARRAERQGGPTGVLVVIAAVATVASALLFAAPSVGGLLLLWPAVVGIGVSAAAWNSVGMLAVIDNDDGATTGRVSGQVLSGFFTGNVISPVAFGAIVDRTGTYEPAWAAITVLFVLALGVAWSQERRERAARPTSRER